jgi:hypothetical protein
VSPGLPDAKIGGAAVRWRLRRGARPLYSYRSSSISSSSSRLEAGPWRDAREWRDAQRTSSDLSGQIRRCLVVFFLDVVLQWLELQALRRSAAGYSINKAFIGRSGGHAWDFEATSASHRGGELGGTLLPPSSWRLHLQQGRTTASPGRFPTAASSSAFSMVERRPLHPQAAVTAASGRRLQVFINLQASLPLRRPSGDGAACSRLHVPSGLVPGDIEVGCVSPLRGGVGAGPDCFSWFSFRVLCANCSGCAVMFFFLEAVSVRCISTDRNE